MSTFYHDKINMSIGFLKKIIFLHSEWAFFFSVILHSFFNYFAFFDLFDAIIVA